jgi:hypothetical protein
MFADAPHQRFVRGDAAAQRDGAPAVEVAAGIGGLDDPVQVTELFFEFPGAPPPVAVPTRRAEQGVWR